MSVAAPPAPELAPEGSRKSLGAWGDRAFSAVALGAGLLVLIVLALIAYTVISKAWPAFKHQGFSFVTSDNWDPNTEHFGALAFIYGTLLTVVHRDHHRGTAEPRDRAVHHRNGG